ncbi:2-isopropylmalate synthase [Actinomycetes bacterium M1A6_2h]
MTTSHAFSDSHSFFAMPAELVSEARSMSYSDFRARYSPTSGPLRMGSFTSAACGFGRAEFSATLAIADTIHSATLVAFGPAEAMTSMLHDAGVHLEILSFHQQPTEAGIVTFALCSNGSRSAWSMGMGSTAPESTARALVAGANRLS